MSLENNLDDFLMVIEDIFPLKKGDVQGICVTGRVTYGKLRKGDFVQISGGDKPSILTSVTSFEGFMRDADTWVAHPGDNIFIFFSGIQKDQLERGMSITKPVK